jgi:hypothetical protein
VVGSGAAVVATTTGLPVGRPKKTNVPLGLGAGAETKTGAGAGAKNGA